MNKFVKIELDIVRKIYSTIYITKPLPSLFDSNDSDAELQGQEASDIIKSHILRNEPFVVGRLGTELFTLLNYKELRLPKRVYYIRYIKKQLYYQKWNKGNIDNLCIYTGFFPPEEKEVERYCEMVLNNLDKINIWGCFASIERNFYNELSNSIKIRLVDIDPFFHNDPWTESLEGKKVLVIHPFERTIISQYKKRQFLFTNKKILPAFELKTIKAVQTLAYAKSEYKNWFDALESMKKKIDKTDFDIAIIGCGAYSLPLSIYVKSLGKSAIYLGGGTQILFGIIGKRWEGFSPISALFNKYWTRPFDEDNIENRSVIEDGCYW